MSMKELRRSTAVEVLAAAHLLDERSEDENALYTRLHEAAFGLIDDLDDDGCDRVELEAVGIAATLLEERLRRLERKAGAIRAGLEGEAA